MARKKIAYHIIGYIFKTLCMILILGVVGIIVWRLVSSIDPKSMKTITPNDKIYDAYNDNGQNLTVFWQDQNSITRAEKNYGYFSVTRALFIDEAEQVQAVFRYNNSTLESLKDDYGLDSVPDRNGDYYDVTLLVAYDLTPDDTSDNDGNDPDSVRFERFYASPDVVKEQKSLYNYRKFTFDGVKIDDSVLAVYVDIYYNQDIDYEKEAYGTLCIYDYDTENENYTISKKEREAIESWKKEEQA